MTRQDDYRTVLRSLKEWDTYLLANSGLPGPRGNLELAQAVADEGNSALFTRYRTYTADMAPVNSPYEFLAFCGVVGLGRLIAEGQPELLATLKPYASDSRWRLREAAAMALQRFGDVDMDSLLVEMDQWADGNFLEQRAAAAALCEPRLLNNPVHAQAVLHILDKITATLPLRNKTEDKEGFTALRKGLGYCWSVAVAALPDPGKAAMEKWLVSADQDIQWIMRENLKKDRLVRMDKAWVENRRTALKN